MDPRGQGIEFLVQESRRSFHHHGGLLAGLLVPLVNQGVQPLTPPLLVGGGLARGQLLQVADQFVPISEPVPAESLAYQRGQDLLSASPADA